MNKKLNKKTKKQLIIVQKKEINPVEVVEKRVKLQEEKWWKYVFVGLAAAIFILMIILSFDAGNSGDEDGFQIPQSEAYYKYYASMGKESITSIKNMEYYPMGFDIVVTILQNWFNIDNTANFRHCCNSIMGWIAILFAGLLAMRIGGWRSGIFTMLLLFLSPRFLGHSFNNPKDIPFAAFMMMGLYYSTYFIKQLPKVKMSTILMLGVAAGLAIASRIAGVLIFFYWGLFWGIHFFISLIHKNKNIQKNSKSEKNKKAYLRISLLIAAMFAIAYIIAFTLFPYAHKEPIKAFKLSFDIASHFRVYIYQLFEGTLQWSNSLPWYYTPKYILMTVPIAVLFGFVLYLFVGGLKKNNRFTTFIVYFAFLFPVFWIIYTNANVYGGWRHAMFTYPPMTIAAGLGFTALIDLFKNRYAKITFLVLPLLFMALPLSHIIRNHPYEYIYFNEISGGVKNAYGKYELDYYYHSTREATEWIIKNAKKDVLVTGEKIKIASWHVNSSNYFLRNDMARFECLFSRWNERGNNDWDYAIFTITGIPPEQIKSKHFPPANTIHTIDVDGKPICLILKRDDKSDYHAMEYLKQDDISNSILNFQKALDHDPYNDTALMNLIDIYYSINQFDKYTYLLDRAKEIIPKDERVNFYTAVNYLNKNDYDSAIKISNQAIKNDIKSTSIYRLLYIIYQQKREYDLAEQTILKMLENEVLEKTDAEQLVEIYKAQGLDNTTATIKFLKIMQKFMEKKGRKQEAELYRKDAEKLLKTINI